MNTTKTSNMSRSSSQKNAMNPKISPSKVKLDIHKEARENEEEDNHDMKGSTKKMKKSKKRLREEEMKVTDLMKIYGL